jgi:UDP-N-acetylglucosamine 2-epimerase (non-hydrolysing)
MFAIVTGTRPEIIKMFPIMKQMDRHTIDYKYIHTGQHFDVSLSTQFLDEFSIAHPDYKIDLFDSKINPTLQIPEMMIKLDKLFREESFDGVIVQGDTNSVLAASLVSIQHNIPIYHVESGLRCFDFSMQEERNRLLVDHMSDVLFASTAISKKNLENENVKGKIYVVGNTVMDAINIISNNEISALNKKKSTEEIVSEEYVAVTLHRYENLSNMEFLYNFFSGLHESNLNYVFPIHPHTLKQMKKFKLDYFLRDRIKIIPPLGYSKFLNLLKKSKFVITDSGGIQEEITSHLVNKCAIVVRPNTERPESIESGHSRLLSDFSKNKLENEIYKLNNDLKHGIDFRGSPYGVGNSAQRIVDVLLEHYQPVSKILN